ncbi:MAG: cupin domain-containing protein [Brochothrix thermosphacta]|uniref:cupin domain-containing protein n=1 Tax=Brochothrix thermosphacta TaxID=2756 RepID=UPI003F8E5C1B
MTNIDRSAIEAIVRNLLMENGITQSNRVVDPSGVISIKLPQLDVSEDDRLDTGNPNDVVYCKDLISLEESPRLGCGLMVMKDTTFDWKLEYDEIDYIIEGRLDVIVEGRTISAGPGEIILVPKGSAIKFSVQGDARFVYVTYPADWLQK